MVYFRPLNHFIQIETSLESSRNFESPFSKLLSTFLYFLSIFVHMLLKFYRIKPSHFSETKIYIKLDTQAVNAAYTLIIKTLVPFTHNGIIDPRKSFRQSSNKIR